MRLNYRQFTTASEVNNKGGGGGGGPISRLPSVMRTRQRASLAVPAEFVQGKTPEVVVIAETPRLSVKDVDSTLNMSQVNGFHREQSPLQDPSMAPVAPPGRVMSGPKMQAVDRSPSQDSAQWSSAVGHASTGKSGRVIERLQGDIDRLNREKKLLKMRFEEVEKANENLSTTNRYLEDRNSNYEASYEANERQLQRKERQIDDLKEELQRERVKTTRAEEAAQAASVSEDAWKEKASQAEAFAQQREAEYDAIVACRNMDNERHQNGLNKLKTGFSTLVKQREDDLATQKKLEIVAEQQKQTIQHLEELTKKLNASFTAYKNEIDSAIADIRGTASSHDKNVLEKVEQMHKVAGEMRWVMCVEKEVNHKVVPPMPAAPEALEAKLVSSRKDKKDMQNKESPTSPAKRKSLDFRLHRRKDSKVSK